MGKLNSETDIVKERLRDAWNSGRIHEACGLLVEDVRPRCIGWLLNNVSAISEEDAEDCFDAAVEGVLSGRPERVRDVYNYVFTSVRNAALDIVQERKNFVRVDLDWIEGVNDNRLLIIAEASLDEELTLRVGQLRKIFALTLPKLAPGRRRLTRLLLTDGAGKSNEDLASTMDISKDALKSLKSRTLSDLRRLLPISADELGIDFDQVLSPPPEVLGVRPLLPSAENEECGTQSGAQDRSLGDNGLPSGE